MTIEDALCEIGAWYEGAGSIPSKEAFDLALISLQKQVPKKGIIDNFSDKTQACPVCKELIPYWCSYCPECGQRLE